MFKRFTTATAALFVCLTCVSGLTRVSAADPRAIVLGATAGPYADQIKFGIKPILEKLGYRVRIVEFHDYVQPNLALAEGSLDANVFQNRIYLQRFAEDHKLDLTGVVKVPTVPMALYSKRHRTLDEVASGATVALPNDPTNQARALAMLARLGSAGFN
jgi:D-methionine transport system substrate-binding protein